MTLADELARRIVLGGPIPFATYMAEALGHPRYGYYRTRDPLGAAGDFVTAPEISQMFGELIGLWCADVWLRLNRPAAVRLVELGPGRGTLMADALRAGTSVSGFREAVSVHLVETSPPLRQRQRQALGDAVHWHDRFDQVPDGPVLLIANEFFDALPVHQFQRTQDGWAERMVAVSADTVPPEFRFVLGPPFHGRDWPSASPGAVVEVCPTGRTIARDIAARIAGDGGAALIIDYGYAGPAVGDSVQAVRGHAYSDPLRNPGESDLTAHVDFSALATAARSSGAGVFGPVGQGAFLEALGIGARAAALTRRATTEQAAAIAAARHRLTSAEAMGTLFKAMAICDSRLGIPAGFSDAENPT